MPTATVERVMPIGALAERTGVKVETIRYYERIGLLPGPVRTGNGYRVYGHHDVARLRFITRGRELGFSLSEIRDLMRLAEDPDLSCDDVDRLARHHLAEIRERQAELQQIAQELERTIADCCGGRRGTCAILGGLQMPAESV